MSWKKDDVEKLKHPPAEYSFIDQDHWDEFVASRLKEDFEKKSEDGKLKRSLYKYNHRTSRKGYANLVEELRASSSSDQIDRSIVWKHASFDRKGEFPDKETMDVANLIDDLMGNQKGRSLSDGDDVLTQAYLHTIMVQGRSSSLFKFMDAGSVSYLSYKQSCAQLLNARLLGAEYDQVVLFPYNYGNHWTLVVVNPTRVLHIGLTR
uniref:Ubiquitin-like protease family profile domain-containing protein n=1 Tax=Cucumis sativus TaxID=3659 RepID=A0A0A0LWT3_CUCSA